MARGAVGRLADFVYPPVCLGCGALAGSHGAICAICWQDIRFIERPFCDVLGVPFSYDPGPSMLSAQAIAHPPVFDRQRSATIFSGAARSMIHGLKYRDRGDLAPTMAIWMERAGQDCLQSCDAILPVPLHRSRFVLRRFNRRQSWRGISPSVAAGFICRPPWSGRSGPAGRWG